MFSRSSLLYMLFVLIFLIALINLLMKLILSSLSLTIVHFFGLNVLFKNCNINRERSMVRCKMPLIMDGVIFILWRLRFEKHEVYGRVKVPLAVWISGGNVISRYRQVQVKRVCNVKKSVLVNWMEIIVWVPRSVPNIEVASHDENFIHINFSILEILQSCLWQVWIYIN